ncbi:MAG: hypothetical protein ACR5K7_02135 [Symbiopectobacterium sp.]
MANMACVHASEQDKYVEHHTLLIDCLWRCRIPLGGKDIMKSLSNCQDGVLLIVPCKMRLQ